MNRVLKVVLLSGLAATVASCGTVRNILPFGLGKTDQPQATASEGQRISVLEFEQQLAPSAALSGRDFFIPGPQAATAWTQPGGNAENAVEHVIGGVDFTVAWRRDIGAGSSRTRQVMAPVVADNGRVFVLDGEATVSALDAGSGAVAWTANLKPDEREFRRSMFSLGLGGGSTGGGFGGGVAVGGGKIFVSSGYRTMTALDQATGAVIWSTPVDVPIHGAPTVSGSRVFVVDVENQIQAFDTTTGQQVWSYRGIPEPARLMRASSPAVTGDTVIAPFSSGEVVALRASTGQAVWQQVLSRASRTSALSEIRDIAGRPVISRGAVYAVSHSGVLSALDIRSGQPKWTLPIAGVNAPLPVGDVVYIVSKTGELTVINRESGQIYWTRDLNEGRVRREGGVLGFWDRTVRPIWSGPLMASNRLVLTNSDGELVAFDPKTGAQTASIRLGGPVFIAPAAYNGALYVLTDKGDLVSIR
ncbi:MAG: PQQ-binding-like beta-propeller repeat protein [Brevundimonas sp.]|uniref:PQQ-like beta-propeller repeat protein n=1 Tax=Brevundimonas sp. TaxID=1871086 RepID=UPI0027371F3B|nr:PQQ-like beta-propeller repeat protein [Brevundimonas sp.]MDP3370153.1 PQQ-binding-like beta-propeller repeat protein [Brevundimonas sp.]MDP3656894.1 PQQ-binding-like beta-propeller repeat protein [Brevundimonas sp.]MDZ4108781.1 PQQ-binding-like beta-propeller repeat protein [Brevundimonas sp.]